MSDERPALPDSFRTDVGPPRRRRAWVAGIALVAVLLAVGVGLLVTRKYQESKRVWPKSVDGPPAGLGDGADAASRAQVTAGIYIWSDFDGWHIRAVNGPGVAGLSGTLEADDEVGEAQAAPTSAGDVTRDSKTITFDLPAEPKVVGVDFNPGFYTNKMTITLKGADGPVDAALVELGQGGQVREVPVVIKKVDPGDADTG